MSLHSAFECGNYTIERRWGGIKLKSKNDSTLLFSCIKKKNFMDKHEKCSQRLIINAT